MGNTSILQRQDVSISTHEQLPFMFFREINKLIECSQTALPHKYLRDAKLWYVITLYCYEDVTNSWKNST